MQDEEPNATGGGGDEPTGPRDIEVACSDLDVLRERIAALGTDAVELLDDEGSRRLDEQSKDPFRDHHVVRVHDPSLRLEVLRQLTGHMSGVAFVQELPNGWDREPTGGGKLAGEERILRLERALAQLAADSYRMGGAEQIRDEGKLDLAAIFAEYLDAEQSERGA
jgi:hypothetical protein